MKAPFQVFFRQPKNTRSHIAVSSSKPGLPGYHKILLDSPILLFYNIKLSSRMQGPKLLLATVFLTGTTDLAPNGFPGPFSMVLAHTLSIPPTENPSEKVISPVAVYNWFEHFLPVIGTVNIPIAIKCSLHIAILIEAEKPMIAGALEIAIVSRAFLVPVGRADRTVHTKNNLIE